MSDVDFEYESDVEFEPSAPPIAIAVNTHHFSCGGITIDFPYEPYETQKQMMREIIKGLEDGTHCLLESPTGTGKTVAFLCAALAWQKKQEEDILEGLLQQIPACPSSIKLPSSASIRKRSDTPSSITQGIGSPRQRNPFSPVPAKVQRVVIPNNPTTGTPKRQIFRTGRRGSENLTAAESQSIDACNWKNNYSTSDRENPSQMALTPKRNKYLNSAAISQIVVLSRTQAQLKQSGAQLGKTAYGQTSGLTLGSKAQMCINDSLLQSPKSLEDDCQNLVKNSKMRHQRGKDCGPVCPFYENLQADPDTHKALITGRFVDIEDVVTYGKENRVCPYFLVKSMLERAKVIFGTYQHVLNPWVMESYRLNVRGNIFIFDEAHNIESTCRDIGTRKINLDNIKNSILHPLAEALRDGISNSRVSEGQIEPLRNITDSLSSFCNWLESQRHVQEGFCHLDTNPGTDEDILVKLIKEPDRVFGPQGFGPKNVKEMFIDYCKLAGKYYGRHEYDYDVTLLNIDPKVLKAFKALLYPFHFLYEAAGADENEIYHRMDHYAVDVVKTISKGMKDSCTRIELSLICLSPKVVFDKMAKARSVILTSGTLSPLDSFPSELGLEFKQQLVAKHCVDRDRIFTAVISCRNEDETPIKFTYENRRILQKQADALGSVIVEICEKIPNGVLVFGPSKSLLMDLKDEWEKTGMLAQIAKIKRVYFEHEIEPKGLQKAMDEYKRDAHGDGAILFSFLRGRISEGMDFRDEQARAVVSVGIPYLPLHDLSVKRKKEYNITMSAKFPGQHYLTGSQWYNVTAFRAINQGLGRSVRHRLDWGTIFLIDERFGSDAEQKLLSSWVRAALRRGGRSSGVHTLKAVSAELQNFLQTLFDANKQIA